MVCKIHVQRMNYNRLPRVMLQYRPQGKRSLGCPRKRWTENVSLRPSQALGLILAWDDDDDDEDDDDDDGDVGIDLICSRGGGTSNFSLIVKEHNRIPLLDIVNTQEKLLSQVKNYHRMAGSAKTIEASATLHADKKTAMTSGPSTSITIPNIEIDAISLVPCSIPSTAESTSSLQQASLPVTSSFTTVAKLDVGFYAIQEKISDEYFKVQILKTPWNPPRDYKFPISTKRNLRFQLKWMERFPWLSYSEYKSGAYCRVCVVMGRSLDEGKGGHQRIGQLVTEPFCKWKNALEIFEAHAKSGYHKRNSELADNFLKVMSSQASSVIQQLSSERKRQQEENRKKLIPIFYFQWLIIRLLLKEYFLYISDVNFFYLWQWHELWLRGMP
ncbi:hypothetical protein C0J52_21700 [Blattella germanica]|nr:hypothetical protein C0J52_21700 [Blattella germanica]